MSRVYIANASSWEEADAHFEMFMTVLPQRRAELAELVAGTGGPVLDRSIESLIPLNEWFIERVLEGPVPVDVAYRPAWLDPPNPLFCPTPGGPRAAAGWLLLLWEQVSVYVGDVLLAAVPGSRWVCWRSRSKAGIDSGWPVVDFGLAPDRNGNAIMIANAGVLRSWSYQGTGDRDDVRPDSTDMHDRLRGVLAFRESYLSEHPTRWQAAPTGPGAHRRVTEPPVAT